MGGGPDSQECPTRAARSSKKVGTHRAAGHPVCASSALTQHCPLLPVYALQEPEVELLLGVLWPARVVDEHQAGRCTPPDLPAGWEGEVHLLQRATSVGV